LAIALDLERGSEFGAAAVTACLKEHVDWLRSWYTGKLLLYSNGNYLKNYILDKCGLDIWLSDPDDNDDLSLYNPVILQSSWTTAIPGVPDPTTDYDEFVGDEVQCYQYFNADEPEPPEPEDEMDLTKVKAARDAFVEIYTKADVAAKQLEEFIAEHEGEPKPPPPPPPPPVPPVPADVHNFKIAPAEDKARANARFIKGYNAAVPPRPMFEIWPSDSSLASERQQFNDGAIVKVTGGIWKGDSGVSCYELYDPDSKLKFKPLYIRKDDGGLID